MRLTIALIGAGVIANSAANFAAFELNAARVQQINDERAANVRRACEDVNSRHDATILKLRAIVRDIPAGPRRDRAEAGMASTIALIDALAPKRDCPALVRRQVTTQQ
jgi:hypothetical protein